MPRTVEEILSQADKLARRFENGELSSPTTLDGAALRDVRHAFDDVARAEQRLAEAVTVARGYGHPWAAIGAMLGTSGEAARQRYGTKRPAPEAGGDDVVIDLRDEGPYGKAVTQVELLDPAKSESTH